MPQYYSRGIEVSIIAWDPERSIISKQYNHKEISSDPSIGHPVEKLTEENFSQYEGLQWLGEEQKTPFWIKNAGRDLFFDRELTTLERLKLMKEARVRSAGLIGDMTSLLPSNISPWSLSNIQSSSFSSSPVQDNPRAGSSWKDIEDSTQESIRGVVGEPALRTVLHKPISKPIAIKVSCKLDRKIFQGKGGSAKEDICVNIFHNGEFVHSKIYRAKLNKGYLDKPRLCSGRRVGEAVELPFMITPFKHHVNELHGDGYCVIMEHQWTDIGNKISEEAGRWSYGNGEVQTRSPMGQYLWNLGHLRMPVELEQVRAGRNIGIIDVVVCLGKADNATIRLIQPARPESTIGPHFLKKQLMNKKERPEPRIRDLSQYSIQIGQSLQIDAPEKSEYRPLGQKGSHKDDPIDIDQLLDQYELAENTTHQDDIPDVGTSASASRSVTRSWATTDKNSHTDDIPGLRTSAGASRDDFTIRWAAWGNDGTSTSAGSRFMGMHSRAASDEDWHITHIPKSVAVSESYSFARQDEQSLINDQQAIGVVSHDVRHKRHRESSSGPDPKRKRVRFENELPNASGTPLLEGRDPQTPTPTSVKQGDHTGLTRDPDNSAGTSEESESENLKPFKTQMFGKDGNGDESPDPNAAAKPENKLALNTGRSNSQDQSLISNFPARDSNATVPTLPVSTATATTKPDSVMSTSNTYSGISSSAGLGPVGAATFRIMQWFGMSDANPGTQPSLSSSSSPSLALDAKTDHKGTQPAISSPSNDRNYGQQSSRSRIATSTLPKLKNKPRPELAIKTSGLAGAQEALMSSSLTDRAYTYNKEGRKTPTPTGSKSPSMQRGPLGPHVPSEAEYFTFSKEGQKVPTPTGGKSPSFPRGPLSAHEAEYLNLIKEGYKAPTPTRSKVPNPEGTFADNVEPSSERSNSIREAVARVMDALPDPKVTSRVPVDEDLAGSAAPSSSFTKTTASRRPLRSSADTKLLPSGRDSPKLVTKPVSPIENTPPSLRRSSRIPVPRNLDMTPTTTSSSPANPSSNTPSGAKPYIFRGAQDQKYAGPQSTPSSSSSKQQSGNQTSATEMRRRGPPKNAPPKHYKNAVTTDEGSSVTASMRHQEPAADGGRAARLTARTRSTLESTPVAADAPELEGPPWMPDILCRHSVLTFAGEEELGTWDRLRVNEQGLPIRPTATDFRCTFEQSSILCGFRYVLGADLLRESEAQVVDSNKGKDENVEADPKGKGKDIDLNYSNDEGKEGRGRLFWSQINL